MKRVYSDLSYQKGLHTGGLWKMQITPREWLLEDPVIDFETGKVLKAIALQPGKFWLMLQLTQTSYDYKETPKSTKSGDYYEISAGGLLNTLNFSTQQVLETLRRHELVVILTDRQRRNKLIGDTGVGMELKVTHTNTNAPKGEQRLQLDFLAEVEDPAPYYNPDNTPDLPGNFLIDTDGNFLLVE